MKKDPHLLVLLVSLSLMLTWQTPAQTFKTLHSFTATTQNAVNFTNSDGSGPETTLVLSGNTLCGTTYFAGTNGTVFSIKTDGTGFTTVHGFTRGIGSLESNNPNLINSDGANPSGGLPLSGKTLYGTAYFGGTNSTGTVFAFNTDGTGFRTLHSFAAPVDSANSDGANPYADPPTLRPRSGSLYPRLRSSSTANTPSPAQFQARSNSSG